MIELPDAKTGRRFVLLNAPALQVLATLPRLGSYVIAGASPDHPRADLNRPWVADRDAPGSRAFAFTTFDTPSPASVPASGSACCVYRKPKPGHSGGEDRQGSRVT